MGKKDVIEAEIEALEKAVGKRLYILRIQKGMKLQTISAFSGVSLQQVAKYEKGHSAITAGTLLNIANNMDIPVASFFPHVGEVLRLDTMVKWEAEGVHLMRAMPVHQRDRIMEIMRFLRNSKDMTAEIDMKQLELLIVNKS